MTDDGAIAWLLDGDPAVRWQTERDLVGEPARVWESSRADIARTGWGRRLLDLQDADGRWDGGWYTPKWTSTTFTLLVLRRFGLDRDHAAATAGCERLLDDARWIDGGVSYWASHREPELCVNAMILSVCAYFRHADPRVDGIARLLLDRRLPDGGWNCDPRQTGKHSSFHTTISTLEALSLWADGSDRATDAIAGGIEFLLAHRLYRSHRTGATIDDEWLQPHFPPRWHYDTLRGLDYLATTGAARDPRAEDAIERLLERRRDDGRWPKGPEYSGKSFFRLEPGRTPGRWNTLRALRVLAWWEGSP